MVCEKCKSENVYVVDTRQKKNCRRRRYKCKNCGNRFNTIEGYENAAFFLDGKWASLKRIGMLAENLKADAADLALLAKMMNEPVRKKE